MHVPEKIPASIFQPLQIERIFEVTQDCKVFEFKQDHSISYKAGQFVTLVDFSGKQEIRRSYSLISSPVLPEPMAIAVKRIANGFFSRKMVDNARVGDQLLTTGASGFFQLPENMEPFSSIYLFAAGSGIAPILSLLKTLIHLHRNVSIYLVYSNHSMETTAFYQELTQMEKQHPAQFHVDFLFSSLYDLKKARLNRELLLEILSLRRFDRKKTLFYVCGPENYMRMIIFLLLEEGFENENIKKEDFNPGNKKLIPRMPPDKNDYHVQIELKGELHNFSILYPDSILQAAKKNKLDLPYSCETGKCGSCAALRISGNVWLSNNEVLTEEDLRNGYTLTCTGHPLGGDLFLKIS
jgi:ferredoxin-NADP reductase